MKANGLKLISLVAILVMLILFVGCDSTQIAADPTSNESIQGEGRGDETYIYDIVRYNDFLQTTEDLPDNFVTAYMLEELGAFYAYASVFAIDFDNYSYALIHENRYYISFDVNLARYNNYLVAGFPEISNELLGPTMATITENIKGLLVSNGLEYVYVNGKLSCIQWRENDVNYSLNLGNEPVEEMPNTLSEDSILRKLLSKDAEDQIAAYNQLVDMVTK